MFAKFRNQKYAVFTLIAIDLCSWHSHIWFTRKLGNTQKINLLLVSPHSHASLSPRAQAHDKEARRRLGWPQKFNATATNPPRAREIGPPPLGMNHAWITLSGPRTRCLAHLVPRG